MAKVYALLVGINDYPAPLPKLQGCVNDIDHFRATLVGSVAPADLAIETLQDADATRANVIAQIRGHLGRAGTGDVAVFHYCGHGARSTSAREFLEFFPVGKDEGLVCVDSRLAGGFDLADKELAVLLAEVAARDPHLAVILDCCHSGSGTRDADSFRGMRARVANEVYPPRPLETYIDGYYTRQRAGGAALSIPDSRHVLLAACHRTQTAKETPDRSGVFTSTLVEVLARSPEALSYADLFVRCRAAVRTRADDQTPQFELHGGFGAQAGFLGRRAASTARRYTASHAADGWQVEAGAIHGLPTDADTPVTFALYPEADPSHVAGTAAATAIGAQRSALALAFAGDEGARYAAEITSLPVAPLLVDFVGAAATLAALGTAFAAAPSVPVAIGDGAADGYVLADSGNALTLQRRDAGAVVQQAVLDPARPAQAAAAMLPVLGHVAQWERTAALANRHTQMDRTKVEFVFAEQLPDGGEQIHSEGAAVLDYRRTDTGFASVRGKLKARNRADQTLYLMLVYFSAEYGVHVLGNEPVPAGEQWVTLWGDAPDDYFYVPDGADEAIDRFKLVVSTEKVDDFLIALDPLEIGATVAETRAIGSVAPRDKIAFKDEWFTSDCVIRTVRRIDRAGAADVALAGGAITVKGHPSFSANLALSAARSGERDAGGTDVWRAFGGLGMTLADLAGTRGDGASILELTDIANAAALRADPLEIRVDIPLAADEALLPLTFDGEHVLLGGELARDDDGATVVRIVELPDADPALINRRSLGGSLRLYFLKAVCKRADVNRLRWIAPLADGGFEYRDDGLADRVARARNILLVTHGIIGDTQAMVAGVRSCGIDARFDCVLAFDYENLGTPIEQTAAALQTQLAAIGLHGDDGKQLTVLAHSMGGLVARWWIEQLGGAATVDHLVMCGTPNHGSPFGKVEEARAVATMLAGLALNYVPAAIPFAGAILAALAASHGATATLAEMDPASDFLARLNAGATPGVRTTILAGDIDSYRDAADPLFGRLLAKIGRGGLFDALFGQQPNDIAAGVASILGPDDAPATAPSRHTVACHHLNYFSSDAGQRALRDVAWG